MITYFNTENGKIRKISESEQGCWVNVVAPDDEEIDILQREFGILPEHISSSLDEEESSRIEIEDEQVLMIVDVPVAEKENDNMIYSTIPIGVIVNEDHVFTIAFRDNPVMHEMANGMIKDVNSKFKTQFVLKMLLRMSARYLQYLKQIDRISRNIEKELRRSTRNKEIMQLLDLRKSLVYFQTSLKADRVTLEKLMRGKFLKLYEDDAELLEDVIIEINQAMEMAEIYAGILTGTTEAFASVISNNLNMVMKILTSITVLMSIPTMIFSYYGMNIGSASGGLPAAGTVWIPLGIAVAVTVVCWIWLYKKDMF